MEGNAVIRRYKETPKAARVDEQLEAELEKQMRIARLMREGVLG